MSIPVWPFRAHRKRIRAFIEGAAAIGGASRSGVISTSRTDGGGFWVIEERVSLRTDALRRSWNSWISRADGGASPIIVSIAERVRQPSGVSSAILASAAALRATQLSVQVTGGGTLQEGHRFTINHAAWGPRAYDIVEAEAEGGGLWTLQIRTPLREAASIAAPLDFADPRTVAVLRNSAEAPVAEDGEEASPVGVAAWAEHMKRIA